MSQALHFLTIAQAGKLIRARKLSPVEYVDHLAARIAALDGQLNSFITPTIEHARAQARIAEAEIMAGRYLGPLHGIPFGLKDVFDTAGILTTGGSRIDQARVPRQDAHAVRKLYGAGALLLGKLATHEFAHGGPSFDLPWPVARNPWDLRRFTGGSSSGSAVAVAAGLLPAALGSDTGGSVRGPASLCGVAGMLPSTGLVSRAGIMPNSFTFDHCGPLAWTAEDCAILLQALAGHDPTDGNSFPQPACDFSAMLDSGVRGLRIGVLRHVWEEELPSGEEHRRALEEAILVMRSLGASVTDCRMRLARDYLDVKIVIGETEIFSVHHQALIDRPGDFGRDFLSRLLPAVMFQSADYVAASREHRRMILQMQPLYGEFDLLFSAGFGPAGLIEAQRSRSFWERANPHVAANITGGPALAVCCGFTESGLPLGMQLMGPPQADATVLRAGHAYEVATCWRDRRPQLEAGATAPQITAPHVPTDESTADDGVRALARALASNAGLRLNADQLGILIEGAPLAMAMAQRIRRDSNRFDEPLHVFRVPGLVDGSPAESTYKTG